jgi:hypothetical protein
MTDAPTLETTALGYEYVCCRSNGADDTAYIHRLSYVAWHGADALPPGYEVHHELSIPWLNTETDPRSRDLDGTPQLVAVDPDRHYRYHLHGQPIDAEPGTEAGA